MSDDADRNQLIPDLSTWTIDQFESHIAILEGRRELEQVRVVAQSNAYQTGESRDVRRRWATLSLTVNAQLRGDDPWDRARQWHQNFTLRAWIIEHLGPDEGPEGDWDPEALAADTLAVLSLDPDQAATMSTHWRDLPIEQIGELRRHRDLTAHLDKLVGYLQAGPAKERLTTWLGVREQLP